MKGPRVHPDYQADKEAGQRYTKMIFEIIAHLFDFFGDEDKAILWLDSPNLNFGSAKPIDLIKMGRAHKVLLFCRNAKEENSPPTVRTH